MAFTDELATGVVPAGAPELAEAFALTPARAAAWTLVAFGALAVLVEPPLLALATGRRERRLRTAGLAGMALALAAAALAPSYGLLLAALALYGPASGLGTNLSEAALVASAPGRAEVALARWSLAGMVGDLLAPLGLAAAVALGAGWRGALGAVAVVAALQALAAARAPGARAAHPGDGASSPDTHDGPPSLGELARLVWRTPALLGWSAAAALCALLDEIVVAFGALWVDARLDASATQRAVVLVALMAGSLGGAALLERLAGRVRPALLLGGSGAGCAAAYVAWLLAPGWQASAVAAALVGAFAAAHHPLLRARAFAALPGRPQLVVAAGALFGPVELALPLAVGLVADAGGLVAAMVALLVQPVAVVIAAVVVGRGRAAR